MGILESGPLGPFRKKVGPVIGRKYRGQDLIHVTYRKSRKAPSAAQLQEREKFALLNAFLTAISPLVETGFKKYAKKKSAVNAAFAYNYPHAFLLTGDQPQALNFPALVYSRGDVATPDGLNVSREGNVLTFNWSAQEQSFYCQFTDKASFLVYCVERNEFVFSENATERYALSFPLQVPNDFAGPLHCYICFRSADGRQVGNSKYAGVC